MMTIIVQIFEAATGSLSGAQAYQELDNQLRQLDVTIRTDLRGVTASFTPPLDPKDNLGYFEYGENAFADQQGEDSDDYLKFTAKAPDGKPFVGRVWPVFIDVQRQPHASSQRADHDHQPVRGDHLLPPQRQPLPARLPGRPGAAVVDRPDDRESGLSERQPRFPPTL